MWRGKLKLKKKIDCFDDLCRPNDSTEMVSLACSSLSGMASSTGHVGLTPQAISVLVGFRPQVKNVVSAVKVVEMEMALQEVGCFSVILEYVPLPVAAAATWALKIFTTGIGATVISTVLRTVSEKITTLLDLLQKQEAIMRSQRRARLSLSVKTSPHSETRCNKPEDMSHLLENGSNSQDLKFPPAKRVVNGCKTGSNNEDVREATILIENLCIVNLISIVK
ncbi:hypothetical protein AgCh_013988 [Apium graveolens]